MKASKLEFVSSLTRSKLIKLIGYFSRGDFVDSFRPKLIEPSRRPKGATSSISTENYDAGPMTNYNFREGFNRQTNGLNEKKAGFSSSQPGIKPSIPNGRKNQDELQFRSREERRNHRTNGFEEELEPLQERKATGNQESRRVQFKEAPQKKEAYFTENTYSQWSTDNRDDYNRLNQNNEETRNKRGTISLMSANETEKLYNEYVSLLEPDSNQEMLVFAVSSLDPMMPNIIHEVMANRALFLKMLNLVDINLPQEHHEAQIRILSQLCEHLNEQRAVDAMQQRAIQRILKSFPLQPKSFQKIFLVLVSKLIHKSRFHC
jgi:hypothetical protein